MSAILISVIPGVLVVNVPLNSLLHMASITPEGLRKTVSCNFI